MLVTRGTEPSTRRTKARVRMKNMTIGRTREQMRYTMSGFKTRRKHIHMLRVLGLMTVIAIRAICKGMIQMLVIIHQEVMRDTWPMCLTWANTTAQVQEPEGTKSRYTINRLMDTHRDRMNISREAPRAASETTT